MCRSFMTCSDNKFCHRRVGVCNLKNILHCVVTLCFAVSSLFTVYRHKFLIIVSSTGGEIKLVPFNAINFECRYRVANNNVGTKWK